MLEMPEKLAKINSMEQVEREFERLISVLEKLNKTLELWERIRQTGARTERATQ